ncbi:C40 family peptidase [Romboutsia sp. Marseille-P6047]|uniref:C40 family peptidase n=1 Tax=Romboutsia sp. Marseille-P6047 TaxID=2161817 RepID=UPI000820C800|nr:SH3 domain-containing protein [Romboutsia sp. Marseille-P6047]SCH38375.1 Probable endopeptidase p60 precursor [uncultured Clostridium sp.]
MNISKKYILSGVIATSVAIPLCSTISNADTIEYRTITANSVNFRTGPGTNYSSMKKLNKGDTVEYIGTSGTWINVSYNGEVGYVHSDYVSSPGSSNQTITKVVTATTLNVRSGAGTNYSKIGTLSKGDEVSVISESNGWAKINYKGTNGYVSNDYIVSKNNSGSSSESIISYKIVTATTLNVRSGAGTNYSKIGTLSKGDEVSVISESNGWAKINYKGTNGYVSSDYIVSKDNSGSSSESITSYKIVTATTLNVRSGPGTSYSKITTISYGAEVGVISESNGWSKIKYNGKTGYVSSQYLSNKSEGSNDSSATNSKVDKLISFAKTLLGKDYSWGAEGPNSFDCSGFTYYVFKQSAGITIPRVSKDQSKYGTYVSRSSVKKGDLVFFDTNGSNDGNVSHVGIYIGNGQFIHASSSKDEVVISDFNSNYYTNAFVNARRVL